jgi:hypothetical protein
MRMKAGVLIPGLGLALLPVLLLAGEEQEAFAKKAQELTQDKTSRMDKLSVIHAFTRDEIREVQTSYS